MLRYLTLRVLYTLPVIWLVVSLVFLLIHLVPGDPILQMLGEGAPASDIQATRHAYGLDVPLAQQYLASRFEADRYRTQLIPRARRAYELYLMKYQQMAAAYPQVLVSQRTLFQLQIDYLRALSTVWISEVALENYALSGGLEAPTSDATMSTTINLPNGGGNE